MSWKRIWAMFKARNYEFFRDKAAFGWNFLFPFLIIAGFGIIFGERDLSGFKVGAFPAATESVSFADTTLPAKFQTTRHLNFIGFQTVDQGLDELKHHNATPKTGQSQITAREPFGANDRQREVSLYRCRFGRSCECYN